MDKFFLKDPRKAQNIPFQQEQMPLPKKMGGRWFRRHLVVDHRHKEILIQILWDGHGELRMAEYHDIIKGAWWSMVPKHRIDEYRHAIASGYKVMPVVVAGGPDGEEHLLMQLIDITDDRKVIKEQTDVIGE